MSTAQAVVLDIEGTTSPLAAVHDQLFPYARARVADWLAGHRDTPEAIEVVEGVRAELGRPQATEAEVVATLVGWIDEDVKARPLKQLQGLIWHSGFQAGDLRGQVYPDVPVALKSWQAAGLGLHIYSSGSVAAQQDWFRHSDHGDLSGHLSGHFDLTTAGPKREAASYRRITEALGVPAAATLFLSDVTAELDAAVEAGWQAVGVRRPGEAHGPDGDHRWITEFGELTLP
ncbi:MULTISPECIES: acireductone synthase [unclassified Crossiella]|uniref:acireductone synthase n=1 Tax=unclassified Crossiella TaxID=2620835 RepID=UPI0020004A85|nr:MULTISPECIES: acireductone synthase [unclassified Crossiella]MCK2241042.1 acireductone synthase [Crossiella sp. S99.2]MCK2253814.1 acireductone synthase [Crossiella sp. S99.1]